jgi:hypothetical protein
LNITSAFGGLLLRSLLLLLLQVSRHPDLSLSGQHPVVLPCPAAAGAGVEVYGRHRWTWADAGAMIAAGVTAFRETTCGMVAVRNN